MMTKSYECVKTIYMYCIHGLVPFISIANTMITQIDFPQCGVVNILWPSDAICCQTSWSTLAEVMAWHLLGAMPLPQPILTY